CHRNETSRVSSRVTHTTARQGFPGRIHPIYSSNPHIIQQQRSVAPCLLPPSPAMDHQTTVGRSVTIEGLGLHSGETVRLTVAPTGSDTGILFRAPDGTLIPANADHVVDGHFATTVGAFGVRVRTIEHLMAAAAGLGIDNLLVDVSGEELPGLDGSAKQFVELLERAGRVVLPARRAPIRIEAPIRVEDGSRWLQVLPSDTLRISYTLDNDHPAIGLQALSLEITESTFV